MKKKISFNEEKENKREYLRKLYHKYLLKYKLNKRRYNIVLNKHKHFVIDINYKNSNTKKEFKQLMKRDTPDCIKLALKDIKILNENARFEK